MRRHLSPAALALVLTPLLLTAPGLGPQPGRAADNPGSLGPQQGGSAAAPATPEQLPPMNRTPSAKVAHGRADYERKAGRDVMQWQARLQDYTAKATAGGPEQQGHARRLNDELTVAKQQLESLKQTNRANWQTQQLAFEQALGRFKADWQRWAPQQAQR